MCRTWAAIAIVALVALVACSRSADDAAKSAPSAQPPPVSSRGSAAAVPGAAAPTVDICAMEDVVATAFGEPFHADAAGNGLAPPGLVGRCDFEGPAPGEVVGIHASHGSRAHIDGFKSVDAAKPVEGIGEVAYFVDLAGSFQLHAYKNDVVVHATYGNGKLDRAKVLDAEKQVVNAIFAKL
jgi:hypothetical protein